MKFLERNWPTLIAAKFSVIILVLVLWRHLVWLGHQGGMEPAWVFAVVVEGVLVVTMVSGLVWLVNSWSRPV